MRGVDVVTLGVTPFQYNPVTRDLTVYVDIRLRVRFFGGGQFGEDRLRNRFWEPVIKQHVLNCASLPEVNFNPVRQTDEDINVEYLIIVPDDPAFISWADSLKRWRNEQGILTGVVTIDDIGGNDAGLIENYIDNAYFTWDIPPVAVLLLSDYQSTGDMYGIDAPIYDDYCVSDNMYADIGGDYLPDLYVGRITAQDENDLASMIGKMLDYERNPYTDPGFYDEPCVAGGWQNDRWFILCADILWGYFHYAEGKNPVREYAGAAGPPDVWSTNPNTWMIVEAFGPSGLGYIPETPSHLTDWGGNATRINDDLNSGAFLIVHRDHGEVNGWSSPAYHNSDLADLSNDMYPYVFSINCLTGKYNADIESFAEAFHRMEYGAVGVMAASEVSYSFVNDTFVWGVWDSMWPNFMPDYGPSFQPEADCRPAFGNVNGKYFLEFSNWPYNPDSKEVTYNLFHHHGDVFLTLYSEMPEDLAVTHPDSILAGATEISVTAEVGSFIGLSLDGEYIGSAEGAGSPVTILMPPPVPGTPLRLTVTKANCNRYIADIPVVAVNTAYVAFNDCDINDAVSGNNNGQWDFNETIDLSIEMKNFGTLPATAVDVTLTSSDPLVSIIDGSEFYGDFNAADSITVIDGFQVQSDVSTPDEHEMEFTIQAVSGGDVWESYFELIVNSPVLELFEYEIEDPFGNNNGLLDPGETIDLLLTIENSGHYLAENVEMVLTTNEPLVSITGNPGIYGNMPPGATETMTYVVTADPAIFPNTSVLFNMDMTALYGFTMTDTFGVWIGSLQNLPVGPDNYGYYAWDDQDGGESHPFNWTEIAPAVGGAGSVLNFTTNNQTFSMNLPFTFTFYGQDASQVYICTNGWLALSYTTSTTFFNSGIPSLNGPGAMIAPFWCNFDPTQTFTEVCTYYDDIENRFIVEWFNVPHYNTPDIRETFQVILFDPAHYPTTTGDGVILVQYETITNTAIGTFGIEDQSETDGIQYGYNGNYDECAFPVEERRTITYTTNQSGGQPDVIVTLTPYGAPIEIPAAGGSFDFEVNVANVSTLVQNCDFWSDITGPGGITSGPLIGPVNVTLPLGFAGTRDRGQTVPGRAPAGDYIYHAYIGIYPDRVWDEDNFNFVKLTTGGDEWIEDWVSSGESFEDWTQIPEEILIPSAFTIQQNYPNPFNPTTTIRYDLPEAGYVSMTIYNISGRKVAELVDGWHEAGYHDVVFDASECVSGIYFCHIEAGELSAVRKIVLIK